MRYEDFILQVSAPVAGRYPVRVLRSPAGEGSGELLLPPVVAPLGRLLGEVSDQPWRSAPARHVAAADAATPPPGAAAHEVGEALFEALFAGQVRSLLDQSIGRLRSAPELGLRIKLKLDPRDGDLAVLEALPWELLRRGDTDDYLSLNRLSPHRGRPFEGARGWRWPVWLPWPPASSP